MHRIVSSRRRAVRLGLGLALAVVALSACNGGQITPITEQGRDLHSMYKVIFWVGTTIFVGVEAAIIYMVVRYRRRKNDDGTLPEQIHGNTVAEIIWTIIPAIIVLTLFVASWRQINRVEVLSDNVDMQVDVQGFQWQWAFTYPASGVEVRGVVGQTQPDLVLPVGKRIRFNLRSDDVIHSFYIPQALYKLDVVPGQHNAFEATFDTVGNFRGECAELCGVGHATMRFRVRVLPQAQFDKWQADKAEEIRLAKIAETQCKPAGTDVAVAASNTSFDRKCLAAPPDTAFKINFDNKDALQHNVAIYTSKADFEKNPAGSELFRGAIVTGPKQQAYDVTALKPGQYYFLCDVHPAAMNGTFNVGDTTALAPAATTAPAAGGSANSTTTTTTPGNG